MMPNPKPKKSPEQNAAPQNSPPIATADPLPPPAYLGADAAQVWRETVAHMAARGTVDPGDATLIETYVAAIVRQRRIAAEIEGAPLMDAEGRVSPLLRIAGSTAATVRSLVRALALDPAARHRLPKSPTKGGSKWADL